MKAALAALFAGLLFALGLGLGGMTDPRRVQAFLDVTGSWDPSLLFVMGGALGTHALTRLIVLKKRPAQPVFAAHYPLLPPLRVDLRLVIGSALFGVGWGLVGYCPGPLVVALTRPSAEVVAFAVAMLGLIAVIPPAGGRAL
jgi:uncharacterized protein